MKISSWTVILLGICVAAVALSYSYFKIYAPNKLEASRTRDLGDQLDQVVQKKKAAENRVAKANQIVADRERTWANIVSTRTPPSTLSGDGINLGVQGYQLALDIKQYRDSLQRLINSRMTLGGVKLIGDGPLVPVVTQQEPGAILSSFFNYPAIPFPVVIFDFGVIRVQGTYEQIVNHVMSWKTLPRYIAVTNRLNFTGTSPILTATYELSIIGYIRGDVVYPALPGPITGGGGSGGSDGGRPRRRGRLGA